MRGRSVALMDAAHSCARVAQGRMHSCASGAYALEAVMRHALGRSRSAVAQALRLAGPLPRGPHARNSPDGRIRKLRAGRSRAPEVRVALGPATAPWRRLWCAALLSLGSAGSLYAGAARAVTAAWALSQWASCSAIGDLAPVGARLEGGAPAGRCIPKFRSRGPRSDRRLGPGR